MQYEGVLSNIKEFPAYTTKTNQACISELATGFANVESITISKRLSGILNAGCRGAIIVDFWAELAEAAKIKLEKSKHMKLEGQTINFSCKLIRKDGTDTGITIPKIKFVCTKILD